MSNVTPIRRRLDLKSLRQAGGDHEFLLVSLVDDQDREHIEASSPCKLPSPDRMLDSAGLTVEDFLRQWRGGAMALDTAARAYGREIYRHLLEQPGELRDGWQRVLTQAHDEARGVRLEIRCPSDSASHWQGHPLSTLPFELMCDDQGYLFRRPGWSTVRRSRELKSREPRLQKGAPERARIKVAWANVQRTGCTAMDEMLFTAHDAAVQEIAVAGRVEHVPSLPAASRQALADALEEQRPHVFVWIGHGVDSGSGLLLHDSQDANYPDDYGKVETANDFAAAIRGGQVDVALLWSCHGAGTFRPLDLGVAEALLRPDGGDVAAVVASFSALDAGAVATLSQNLIQSWGRGDGDLEDALARARGQLDELSLTWARPVLFLRTPLSAPGPNLFPQPPLAPIPTVAQPNRLRWVPQLPPQAPSYIDHHHRLNQLQQDLAHHPVVVLEGLAGIGKTELALTLAHRLRSQGEDVVFVDLSAQRGLSELRVTLGQTIREASFDDDQQLIGALKTRHWTLVLDNAEDLDEKPRKDLLELLAALCTTGPNFRAVVTTRHALAKPGESEGDGLFSRELQLLDLTESRELFVATAGPRLSAAQNKTKVLEPLLIGLGGIARAVVLMVGQLGDGVDVPELHRRLVEAGTAAIVEPDLVGEELSPALDNRLSKSSLQSALRLSLNSAKRQSSSATDLFYVIGTLPGGLLQFLLPSEENLSDAISALLDHHLVHLAGEERRIMMAAPVREWARQSDLADSEGSQTITLLDAVHQNLADYAGALSTDLGTERAQAAKLRFLPESSNLVQTILLRLEASWTPEDDRVSESFFRSLSQFALLSGTARSMVPVLESFFSAMVAKAPNSHMVAWSSTSIGAMRDRIDNLTGARQAYDQALPIFRQIDDRLGEANTLQTLGNLHVRTDDLAGALQDYEQALAIYRQIDDRLGEANTLRALGDLYKRTDDLTGALQAYEQALPIFRQIDHRLGEANTLRAVGDLHMREADLVGALQAYDQALPIFRQIDHRLGEANTLRAVGDLNVRTGDLASAFQAYKQALPVFRQIDDRLGEANTLLALGDLHVRTDDLAGALQAYEQAFAIYRQIDTRMGEANTLKALGDLSARKADLTGALQAYDQALTIFRQIDDRLGEANTLKALGDLHKRKIDLVGALQAYEQALPIYRQIDERMGEANTLRSLGMLELANDRPDEAFAFMLDAMSIQRSIGDRLGIGGTHGYFVRIAASVGAVELAIGHGSQATRIFAEVDYRFGQCPVLTDLGQTLLDTRPAEGIACLIEAETIAKSIGDPGAAEITLFINSLRDDDAPQAEFEAQLGQLRSEAPKVVQSMFADADAAVNAGEIDLYTFPDLATDPDDGS